MHIRRAIAPFVVLMTVALTAQAAETTRQIPVNQYFIEGEIRWSSGGRLFVYAINFVDVGGVVEFCGAVAYDKGHPESRQFLRDSALVVNGRTVIEDLSYWNTVGTADQLPGSMANCRSTGIRADATVTDVDIRWSEKDYLD